MSSDRSPVTYNLAKAALDAGNKLHLDGTIYLVRQVVKGHRDELVLWVCDQRTPGDHGWLLYPDGSAEAK
jgi:hypothetical protein